MLESGYADGYMDDGMSGDGYGGDPTANERFFVCSWLSPLNELSINSGLQSFKGPLDLGANGNIGTQIGVNLGDSIWHQHGLGYQVGAQYVGSDLYGAGLGQLLSTNMRDQVFVTAGLFHRAYYNHGWQGGAVVDYLRDNYYVTMNMTQIRAELSYVGVCGHEFGFWGTGGSKGDRQTIAGQRILAGNSFNFQPTSLYAFFYRKTNNCTGSQARFWAGFTEPVGIGGNNFLGTASSSLMFGADFRHTLGNKIDFIGSLNYLASSQGGAAGQAAESYGMVMNLVFYPFRLPGAGPHNGPYRPLFNVADNSTFITQIKP